jgi:hypothetical protein
MLLRTLVKIPVLAASLLFIGCPSFEPGLQYQDLMRPRQPTVKETQQGLELSIARYGILALLFKAENGGSAKKSLPDFREILCAFRGAKGESVHDADELCSATLF